MNEPPIYGINLFGETVKAINRAPVAAKFVVPPFSVLNAREDFWQERKRAWIDLGIKGEVSREEVWGKGDEQVRAVNYDYEGGKDAWGGAGVSVFDPVVCELVTRWFSPERGLILDPFAGGSVRGIVAEMLNRRYYGIELREEQVEANKKQASEICPDSPPIWICGDSMVELENAPEADFVFTCPPYGDLEKYSDDPRDLSAMEYHAFIAALNRIIMRACAKLKPDRFACVVVGDFRDEKGNYRNFVSDTISAFRVQGLELYNEAILVTPIGSLPIRITRQFEAGRKLGKTHQNILVFVKGDGKKAAMNSKGLPVRTA